MVDTPAKTALLSYDQQDSTTRIEIEISHFFSMHPLELYKDTILQIQYRGTQIINVTPINSILEEIAAQSDLIQGPISYFWSAPDTTLTVG